MVEPNAGSLLLKGGADFLTMTFSVVFCFACRPTLFFCPMRCMNKIVKGIESLGSNVLESGTDCVDASFHLRRRRCVQVVLWHFGGRGLWVGCITLRLEKNIGGGFEMP
jgi:hypothetical protein